MNLYPCIKKQTLALLFVIALVMPQQTLSAWNKWHAASAISSIAVAQQLYALHKNYCDKTPQAQRSWKTYTNFMYKNGSLRNRPLLWAGVAGLGVSIVKISKSAKPVVQPTLNNDALERNAINDLAAIREAAASRFAQHTAAQQPAPTGPGANPRGNSERPPATLQDLEMAVTEAQKAFEICQNKKASLSEQMAIITEAIKILQAEAFQAEIAGDIPKRARKMKLVECTSRSLQGLQTELEAAEEPIAAARCKLVAAHMSKASFIQASNPIAQPARSIANPSATPAPQAQQLTTAEQRAQAAARADALEAVQQRAAAQA